MKIVSRLQAGHMQIWPKLWCNCKGKSEKPKTWSVWSRSDSWLHSLSWSKPCWKHVIALLPSVPIPGAVIISTRTGLLAFAWRSPSSWRGRAASCILRAVSWGPSVPVGCALSPAVSGSVSRRTRDETVLSLPWQDRQKYLGSSRSGAVGEVLGVGRSPSR